MIIGMGNDLANIDRIDALLKKFGTRFEARVFSDAERAKAAKRADKAPTYAKRFAAKEACAKALGTGINRGVYFKDMSVENLPSGQPTLVLSGGALARAQELTPAGMTTRVHLSLTDDYPWAQAFVILEAI